MNYPLAKQGVFRTIQGEGHLLGVPMTFVRFAGCSVGCENCDTDYSVHRRVEMDELVREICGLTAIDGWVWLTGGEPTDHDILPLVEKLNSAGLKVALATSGHRRVAVRDIFPLSWLSVSPHDPTKWVQLHGSEVKIVPGLKGGTRIRDFETPRDGFQHHYVLPCDGQPDTVQECVEWVEAHPNWKMTVQAHKLWRLA